MKQLLVLLAGLSLLTGCAVNPVTGKKELSLVSEAQELSIGEQQYGPMRQAQGGDYVVDPAVTAYVNEVGQRLAAVSDRKLPYEFHVLNSSVPNAWALPGGKIVINRGLLTELGSEAELAAVLGHEITHAAAKHTARGMSRSMLLQGALLATVVASQGKEYAQLAQTGASLGAQLITRKYGRDAEREADYYGMLYMSRAGYDPRGAVELQKTFLKLSEGRAQDWLSGLFASHPPSRERVENNLQTLAQLPPGGDDGKRRFATRLAHLRQTQPAYEAYDQGRKSLAENRLDEAARLARRALHIEPREAHFHALLGDIALKQEQTETARKRYSEAIALNNHFFYYYLQRGLVNEQLGRKQRARQDLDRSIKLLPTANAYNALGDMARDEQRFSEAKQYYARAAADQSAAGKQAYGSLVELDLPDNPGKYIKTRIAIDERGRVRAKIVNDTPRPVTGMVLAVRFTDPGGRERRGELPIRGTLPAGKSTRVDLGLDGLEQAARQTLRAGIVKAQIAR